MGYTEKAEAKTDCKKTNDKYRERENIYDESV